jgi:hypothetical protein
MNKLLLNYIPSPTFADISFASYPQKLVATYNQVAARSSQQ